MKSVDLFYFSPTGTTAKICQAIAEGLSATQTRHHDLTQSDQSLQGQIPSGMSIVGVPVYAGRVPDEGVKRLADLRADGTPVVLVALYGNREYEDALVELEDILQKKGFSVIAAGAFIGEHSYSTPHQPIAAGRPDEVDLEVARNFGRRIRAKMDAGDNTLPQVVGNRPYREGLQLGGIAPETVAEKCVLCGACALSCPMGIIQVDATVETDKSNCIMCCACLRACTYDARLFDHPVIEQKRAFLQLNCSVPKRPVVFL